MRAKTCCITGHRPQSLPWGFREDDPRCQDLKKRLASEILRLIREEGVRHFISGMALGMDTWFAEQVLEYRDRGGYPITLECALPCGEQAARWNGPDRERYFALVQRSDKESLLQCHYSADCFQKRNRYMVRQSDVVLAVWNGAPSGTGATVAYARELGRTVIQIPPVVSSIVE